MTLSAEEFMRWFLLRLQEVRFQLLFLLTRHARQRKIYEASHKMELEGNWKGR